MKPETQSAAGAIATAWAMVLAIGAASLATGCAGTASSVVQAPAAVSRTDAPSYAAKCPGIAYLKKKSWTDSEIAEQMQVAADAVGVCESWVSHQPDEALPSIESNGSDAAAADIRALSGGTSVTTAP